MDKKISKNIIKFIFGLLIIAGIWLMLSRQYVFLAGLTPAAIRDYIRNFGSLAPVIYIIAYALNTILCFPPIGVMSLTAGLAFGRAWGAIFLMFAAMMGTASAFLIARYLARSLIERLAKEKFRNFDDAVRKMGFLAILFLRLVPLVPYEILNYAAGLSKIKFKDYFLATLLGLIPGVIISALFGGALGEIKMPKDFLSPKFLGPLVLLVLAILIPVIYAYLERKKTQDGKQL